MPVQWVRICSRTHGFYIQIILSLSRLRNSKEDTVLLVSEVDAVLVISSDHLRILSLIV